MRYYVTDDQNPQLYLLPVRTVIRITVRQCFLTTRPWPGTGPWHQLYRAARGSPGICHFSFL